MFGILPAMFSSGYLKKEKKCLKKNVKIKLLKKIEDLSEECLFCSCRCFERGREREN